MKQEYKELLFKDLCSRLNTKLVCSIYRTDDEGIGYRDEVLHGYCKGDIWYEFYFREDCSIGIDNVSKIKPYLFPLSSMTEEQYKKWCDLEGEPLDEILNRNANGIKMTTLEHHLLVAKGMIDPIQWCYKNHFDINGLIPIGLAIDATNLNIY